MPLYEYGCACGATQTAFKAIVDRNQCPHCVCGQMMVKKITNSRVYSDLDYVEENLGNEPVRVKGRRHLRELMKSADVYERPSKHRWV